MTNTQFAIFLNNIDNGIVAHHVKHDPNGVKVLSDMAGVDVPEMRIRRTMLLGGRELVLGENDSLPCLCGETVSGKVEVAPGGCTFIVL